MSILITTHITKITMKRSARIVKSNQYQATSSVVNQSGAEDSNITLLPLHSQQQQSGSSPLLPLTDGDEDDEGIGRNTDSAHMAVERAENPTPRTSNRFIGLEKTWLSMFYWGASLIIVVLGWVMVLLLNTKDRKHGYGLVEHSSGPCSEFELFGGKHGAVIFALNTGAAFVYAASDHFRANVIAPSPEKFEREEGLMLGVPSRRMYAIASASRKVIFTMLLLTSFPLYFLCVHHLPSPTHL